MVAHDGYLMADLKGAVNERYIRKRSSTYLEQFHMEEHGILYLIEIGIGSPPQQVYALIDTGSSDTIIKTEAFNTKYSTTFRGFKYHPFYIVYSAGQMSGIWALETLRIYKQFTIKNYFLAIIDQNTDVNGPPAIIGVGYQGGEEIQTKYDNFLFRLVDEGLINTPAFSIWFDNQNTNGSILFGGIDTEKYAGELQSLPIQQVSNSTGDSLGYIDTRIVLDNVSVNGTSYNVTEAYLWDTGSFYASLKSEIINEIATNLGMTLVQQALNRQTNKQMKAWGYECGSIDVTQQIQFQFEGLNPLNFTIADFQLSREWWDGSKIGVDPYDVSNSRDCILGIIPLNANVFGTMFMRQLYTVFNLKRNTISYGPRQYSDSKSIITI